jgi:hypothetical protein
MILHSRALTLAVVLAIPTSAAAHHGWAWTADEETRLSGTIVSISFGNPHMHLQLRTDQGLYEVDLSPPVVAQGSGFGPGAAKSGDRVVLTGHQARDAKVRAFKGETITVYPNREKTLKPA